MIQDSSLRTMSLLCGTLSVRYYTVYLGLKVIGLGIHVKSIDRGRDRYIGAI